MENSLKLLEEMKAYWVGILTLGALLYVFLLIGYIWFHTVAERTDFPAKSILLSLAVLLGLEIATVVYDLQVSPYHFPFEVRIPVLIFVVITIGTTLGRAGKPSGR